MADRAYDTNAIRQQIEQQDAVPNIPQAHPDLEKLLQPSALPPPQRGRAHVCRLKDYRRIATRYDKLATTFASSVYLAAAISFWL